MIALRAITAFTGFLGVVLLMSLLSVAWWMVGAWPPPSRSY